MNCFNEIKTWGITRQYETEKMNEDLDVQFWQRRVQELQEALDANQSHRLGLEREVISQRGVVERCMAAMGDDAYTIAALYDRKREILALRNAALKDAYVWKLCSCALVVVIAVCIVYGLCSGALWSSSV